MDLLSKIKEIETLKDVPDEQLQWLIDNGEVLNFEEGDPIFRPGDPIDRLIIGLEGRAVFKIQQGNQYRVMGELNPLDLTGYLPYSRAQTAQATADATEPMKIFVFPKAKMREMIQTQDELTTALVHHMSTRIREFTKSQQLNDKMMSLGKLSAGLAHELNNPSAAIVRSARSLGDHLRILPEGFKKLLTIDITEEQADFVNQVLFEKVQGGIRDLNMMERSEKEDDLLDWLDDNEIDDSDTISENLVEFGYEVDDLDDMKDEISENSLPAVIKWINQTITTNRLIGEIEEASQRINKLVTSIKSYTHMDQAPEKAATDIHIGINNTLTMLNHKINGAGIEIQKDFEDGLPQPEILASEMNQVWTNLIDNAVDAMDGAEKKILTIRTFKDREFVNVIIGDSGSGIPQDIQDKIFDPFFTTKEVGKGTGLGMEVVQRIIKRQHNGAITFTSEPGKTEFKVCLPVNSN
ncbi:MAG: ATP-binding protein [Crocinitomicaceae bacterium]|nr:ATP-binding protein [Crocinitomicaceae bacterium]